LGFQCGFNHTKLSHDRITTKVIAIDALGS